MRNPRQLLVDVSTSSRVRRSRLLRLAIALSVGLAEPYLEIAWKCRTGFATTEACVWGKSYLPLSRWLVPLLVAPVVYAVLSFVRLMWLSRRSPERDQGDSSTVSGQ